MTTSQEAKLPNPSGLCMCGCGSETTRAKETSRRNGHVAGAHVRYVRGHQRRKTVAPAKGYRVDPVTGCWIWLLGRRKGYGCTSRDGKTRPAHKVLYEAVKGPVPAGLVLDHLCRNRACVNPEHLEPVTNRENLLRGNGVAGTNSRKTHCPKGHPYSAENTRLYRGKRFCRICARLHRQAREARERAAA